MCEPQINEDLMVHLLKNGCVNDALPRLPSYHLFSDLILWEGQKRDFSSLRSVGRRNYHGLTYHWERKKDNRLRWVSLANHLRFLQLGSNIQPGGRLGFRLHQGRTGEKSRQGLYPPLPGRGPISIARLEFESQRRGDIDQNESENVFPMIINIPGNSDYLRIGFIFDWGVTGKNYGK